MAYSPEELNNIVDTIIIDNNLNLVTPAKVRQVLKAVISSLVQTNAGAVSAAEPLDYDGFTNVFSIPKADADNDGYLSKEDWVTFNSAGVPGMILFKNPSNPTQGVMEAGDIVQRVVENQKIEGIYKTGDGDPDLLTSYDIYSSIEF